MTCSTGSSPRSPSHSSTTSPVAWSVAPWQSMLDWIWIVCVVLVLALMLGCSRTVLVSEGSPVRMGPDATARVYALVDGEWQLSQNKVTVPEGWYLVPPSFVGSDKP